MRPTLLATALHGALHCTLWGSVLALALPTMAQAQAPATAQAATNGAAQFNIPAGALAAALDSFARTAGVNLSYDAALVAGKNTAGVNGSHSHATALHQLLAGTGVEAVAQAGGGFSLKAAPPPVSLSSENAGVLPEVVVSGKAIGSTTEGTGSYTTWSTSSSTRLNLTPQETPQPITVITRQRMEDQGLENLIDVLGATAGVTVKSFGLGADAPQMVARGANLTNFQIDGIPSASAMSNYVQSSVLYDRVEVVKGATGMMSGLGTPSATVNMIRKRPTAEAQTSLTAEGGNWSRYGLGVDASRALNENGTVRARLVADYKRQGAWASNYQQDYRVLYGIGEVDLTDRTLLTLGFSHITRKTDSPMRSFAILYDNGQPTGYRPSDSNSPKWSYYDHEHNNVFASVEHRFDSGWVAKSELTHARYEYDGGISSLAGSPNQTTGAGTFAQSPLWRNKAEQTTLDTYVTGAYSLLGRQHELIAGVTLSQLDQKSPGFNVVRQNITDPFNWANEATRPEHTQTGHSKTKEHQYSAYLSTRLQVSDATSLLLGSRVTNWKRDRDSYSFATGLTTNNLSKESHVVIPYAGIVHALNDTYSLYASYTKIFNPQGVGTVDVNQMPIDPEEGTSYETGIKASFYDGALTSSLSLFRTERDSLAQWNGTLYAYEALNGTATEGVELELNGELTPGWQFSAGYTYSESRNKDDKRIMTRIPRTSLKLFSTYRLPGDWNRFTLGGGVNWESKTGDPMRTYTQKPFALVNLMARYEVNKQLAIAAHLNNAFDKRYYEALTGRDGFFGAPRNVMVSAKYSF